MESDNRLRGAIELLMAEVDGIVAKVRGQARNAADHLERCCEAIMFNANEGMAAIKPKVKLTAYEICKKEAGELRAILRRLIIKRVITTPETRRATNLAAVVTTMLTGTMLKIQKRIDDEEK